MFLLKSPGNEPSFGGNKGGACVVT